MIYEQSEGLKALARIFGQNGFRLYLVGGSVRNLKLGLPGGDCDVCSAALPDYAAMMLKKAGLKVIEKALSLGTIEVHLSSGGKKYVFEHTTLRRDYYRQGGEHRPYKVEFTDSLEMDARRRDFTVNALYLDIQSGKIYDPTGHGINDIENKTLRAAQINAVDTLGDDGLRIMRMIRLSAELGFSIDAELYECAKKYAGLLDDISAERKRQELEKILMADTKYSVKDAHLKGLRLLSESGALRHVLPELEKGRGVEQKKQYHAYDVLDHCIHTCAAAPAVFELRLAALLHDIGKPEALKSGGNMYGHEKYSAVIAKKLLSSLKFDNDTIKTVLILIENHMFDLDGKAKSKTIRKRAVILGRENFKRLVELRIADVIGSGRGAVCSVSAGNWQNELDIMIKTGVPFSVRELNITGDDLIEEFGLEPSEKIGGILNELFWYCVYHPGANSRQLLIKRAERLL